MWKRSSSWKTGTPEVGAEFSSHMWQPGVFETRGTGHFTEVEPPNLLAYVMHANDKLGVPDMHVRVELKEVGQSRTEVTLTQSGIPGDIISDVINGGWTASMAQLEAVVSKLLGADAPAESHQ